ncbi:tyrosine-type recombinase/integrase [Sphaerisporangium sp. NPDC051011]|uniref:tyrosine-type recombinase/integrase n=1 Tax=Sphaerisporangium sp. NPDC051011 TaxID=3155792 RepID=UPI0033E7AAC2
MPADPATNVIAFDRARRSASPPAAQRPRARPKPVTPGGAPLATLIESWRLALEEANKSPRTIEAYVGSAHALLGYLRDHDLPVHAEGVEAAHVRACLKAELDRTSPVSAHKVYRALNVFWKWIADERERHGESPMINVKAPQVATKVKPPLSEEEIAALLKVCSGAAFADRRDTAIIRILVDNGMRVSGLAGLRYVPDNPERNDVWPSRHQLRIRLKGGDEHIAPIGKRAAAALDRYLRVRAGHRCAVELDWLWLSPKGRLTVRGIQQMLDRRGEQAGIEGQVHPHRFRRTTAHMWLEEGGDPLDLMQVAGWRSLSMVQHYAAEKAGDRARKVHARLSPGDRI